MSSRSEIKWNYIVVPDLESIVLEYIGKSRYDQNNNKYINEPAGDRLQYRLMLRNTHAAKGNVLMRIYNTIKDYNTHKWMYDKKSLKKIMKQAGFSNLKKMKLNTSNIKGISKIEKADRVSGGIGLCIEGVKK